MGGNDIITGNGNTPVMSYRNATGAVTVDLARRHGDGRRLGRDRHLHAA